MFDSKGAESSDIEIKLTERNDGTGIYILTLIPNEEWLNDGNRIYPITLDPPISTSLDRTSIYDAHVSEGLPNSNF